MPIRHGFFRSKEKPAPPPMFGGSFFLIGIYDIFDGLAHCDFIQNPAFRGQAKSLEFHFRRLIRRLLHSLDLLQQNVSDYESFYSAPFARNELGQVHGISSSMSAESVMLYINIFLDDIARLVPLALDSENFKPVDSFGMLKRIVDDGQYPIIRELFCDLHKADSWWGLSLKRKEGIRQRLVHYTDIIDFTGTKINGEEKYKVESTVWNPITGGERINFIASLKTILHGLCEWLDGLEEVLSAQLLSRASASKISWSPSQICPNLIIPIKKPLGIRELPEEFLYLPLCENSASSKCQFKVVMQESENAH